MSPAIQENVEQVAVSEFARPCWSVVSMEECAASGLNYEEAAKLVQKMSGSISGLCIVTDQAAGRLYKQPRNGYKRQLSRIIALNKFTETL